jgi:transposase
MARKQKSYSEAFKRELVAQYEAGDQSAPSLEREYDVGQGNLYRWIKKYGSEAEASTPPADAADEKTDQERIRDLEREVAILRQERDILKKAVAIFARPKRNGSSS